MASGVYYNELDPLKAEVLREAIKHGAIALGDVDERSISDVRADDLRGYTQCHFFAGGGFWSLALRYAGWPDDRPAWTASTPCPSFSAAGKGRGFDDARHLWPYLPPLIRELRPPVLFGEQVGAAIAHGWLDLVSTDLEAEGYAVAAAVFGACSVGAPHRRSRLYFCADTPSVRYDGRGTGEESFGVEATERSVSVSEFERLRDVGDCTDADGRQPGDRDLQRSGEQRLFAQDRRTGECPDVPSGDKQRIWEEGTRPGQLSSGGHGSVDDRSDTAQRGQPVCGSAPGHAGHASLASKSGSGPNSIEFGRGEGGSPEPRQESGDALTEHGGSSGRTVCSRLHTVSEGLEGHFGDVRDWRGSGWLDPHEARSVAEAGATRGFWADCDWWLGRAEPGYPEGRYRPIGPGLQPLAHGSPARVGRLRLYGDGIVVTQAKAFIEAYREVRR